MQIVIGRIFYGSVLRSSSHNMSNQYGIQMYAGNVQCTGSETDLVTCPNTGIATSSYWGYSYMYFPCSDKDPVALRCFTDASNQNIGVGTC